MSRDSFAAQLRDRRLADDLTQAELAGRFGVRQQTIGAWERGDRPQSRFLPDLAHYLGLADEDALQALLDHVPDIGPRAPGASNAPSNLSPVEANMATLRKLAESYAVAVERGSVSGESATAMVDKFYDYFSA